MATVKQGQSIIDMVIETTGDIANVFEMALLNSVGMTEFLPIGTEIKPAGKFNKTVIGVFNINNKPATYIGTENIWDDDDYWDDDKYWTD